MDCVRGDMIKHGVMTEMTEEDNLTWKMKTWDVGMEDKRLNVIKKKEERRNKRNKMKGK